VLSRYDMHVEGNKVSFTPKAPRADGMKLFGNWVGFSYNPSQETIQEAKKLLFKSLEDAIMNGDFIFCDNSSKFEGIDPVVEELSPPTRYTLGLKIGTFAKAPIPGSLEEGTGPDPLAIYE